jgi:hypothetical protein
MMDDAALRGLIVPAVIGLMVAIPGGKHRFYTNASLVIFYLCWFALACLSWIEPMMGIGLALGWLMSALYRRLRNEAEANAALADMERRRMRPPEQTGG